MDVPVPRRRPNIRARRVRRSPKRRGRPSRQRRRPSTTSNSTIAGLEGCQFGPNLLIQESPAFTALVHMLVVALVAGRWQEQGEAIDSERCSESARRDGGGAPPVKDFNTAVQAPDKSVSLVIKLPRDCSIHRRLYLIERRNEGCWHRLCTELPRIQVLGNVADIVAFFRGGIHVF
jgi:hypothetical protein